MRGKVGKPLVNEVNTSLHCVLVLAWSDFGSEEL